MNDRALIAFDSELLERLQAWCAENDVTVESIVEVLLEDIEAPASAPARSSFEDAVIAVVESEDEPDTERPRRRRGRPRRSDAPAPALELANERVITHDELVARLARDRAVAIADGGDAGGMTIAQTSAPTLVGHTDEKREVCAVHGWVGRVQFERAHTTCELAGEPCRKCHGRKYGGNGPCFYCHGTGVDRPTATEADQLPPAAIDGPHPLYRASRDWRRATSGVPRPDTTATKHLTREVLRRGALEVEQLTDEEFIEPARPKTRAECIDGPRPCPWVSCRHHLYLDVNPQTGSIQIARPDVEPEDLEYSCALDVAGEGEHTLDIVGQLLNVTRERVRQIEARASHNLKAALHGHLRITADPGPFITDRTEAA